MDEISTLSLNNLPKVLNHDLGLYNGKMGACVAYYIKGASNSRYKTMAAKMFDEIIDNIANVECYSFSEGLLGIGWAIEWLNQNNFIKLDTDDFLEDLDDEIYKLIMYSKARSIDLNTGTVGRILYLYKRVTAQNPNRNFYRDICNKECLVLLIDELHEKLLTGDNALLNKRLSLQPENISNISQVLIMLCKLVALRLNYDLVKEMICKVTLKIEEFLTEETVKNYDINVINLIGAWLEAGDILLCDEWVAKSYLAYDKIKHLISLEECSSQQLFISSCFQSQYCTYTENDVFSCLALLTRNKKTSSSFAEAWLVK
ncbi:lanthionine synthetase LanC family protein [Pedobacter endophyticus]|uniref:Lanthionine synthetase C-like protein n=1 Tax=Pedobacter endophyticus TaxID=2789740 RepID=A0A7S9PYL4_9SPHI|nr:lanthionine synthetase LanC family protein [Pedobacter endophyticus]QPH38945.1 hypothetical protein IZT61_18055 [Pedobacter endophyticus]